MAKEKTDKKRILRDIIFIIAVASAGLILLFLRRSRGNPGSYAEVYVNAVKTERYPLDKDGIYLINGGTNVLEIKDGQARMAKASCPDLLCVRQGWIRYTGQTLVCLPNKVVITLTGEDGSVDIIN